MIPMERKIREIINSNGIGEFRRRYFKNNRDGWHILCSSMDVIGDTTLAISNFRKKGIGSKDGEKYLRLYGVLQSIFLQQDAIKFLYKTIKNSCDNKNVLKKWGECLPDTWKEIRKYRNLIVGHPVDNSSYEEGKTKRVMISRMTISDNGFQLVMFDPDNPKVEFKNVNLDIIDLYLLEAQTILSEIEGILKNIIKKQ